MAKITTENFRAEIVSELYNSFSRQGDIANSDTSYYIMAGVSVPDLDESGNQIEITNTQFSKRNFQRKVIFGNAISRESLRYMFDLTPWESGKVYDAYDDTRSIENSNMFAAVLDGQGIINESSYKIFKCIKNDNNGTVGPSTVPPFSSSDSILNNYEVALSDGYVWKYMFEVIPSEYILYGTNTLLPLPYPGDPKVIASAKEEVSDILIEDTRENLFQKYVSVSADSDNGVFLSSDPNNTSQTSNANKVVSINAGAISGEVLTTTDSYKDMHFVTPQGAIYDIVASESIGNIIKLTLNNFELESETDVGVLDLNNLNEPYSIVPKISVSKSTGKRCLAYAKLSSFGTIEDIILVEKGSEYKIANAEVVLPINLAGENSDTTLRCVVSPKGGHGSNPIKEMAMSKISVSGIFGTTFPENPTTNFYSQVALIKNPEFETIDPVPLRNPDGTYIFDDNGNIQYATTIVEENPVRFDNRTFLRLDGNLTFPNNILQTGYIIEKDIVVGGVVTETIRGVVHELTVTLDNKTEVYLTDYDGPYIGKFQRGTADTQDNDPDLTVRIINPNAPDDEPQTASINNSTDSVRYGTYKAYSGELLHFVDFAKIERLPNRQERIKFIFDF